MNKEINHDQISSVDQIDQFKWTVRVLEGGKFGQSFKKTFKHGGKFLNSVNLLVPVPVFVLV